MIFNPDRANQIVQHSWKQTELGFQEKSTPFVGANKNAGKGRYIDKNEIRFEIWSLTKKSHVQLLSKETKSKRKQSDKQKRKIN